MTTRRRCGWCLWVAFGFSLVVGRAAHAHGAGDDQSIMASLDKPPAALARIKVALHKTLGAQLVVENRTGTPLEILGTDGLPFLRLGPNGVEANVNAPDWYRFYSTAGAPQPERLLKLSKGRHLPADWQLVSRTPAWGWFDARLNGEGVVVPHRVRAADRPATLRAWRIPVTFGGRPDALGGRFRYVPRPRGFYEARLRSASEIAPGAMLQLLQGPIPGFLLENTGPDPITILDQEQLPFLEIGPDGVRANLRSTAWIASGLAESGSTPPALPAGAGPLWQQRSATPRLTWLDPRAASSTAPTSRTGAWPPERRVAHRWAIPFLYREESRRIDGETHWVSYGPANKVASATATR